MKKDANIEYIQKLRNGGVYNKALNYVNNLRPVKPSAPSVETPSETPDYLCFTATGESTVGIKNFNGNAPVLFYSKDKENWKSWKYSTITLKDGESVYFYGENPNGFNKGETVKSWFTMTGSIAASGNIQTLLSQKGDRLDVTEYCYNSMFYNCTSLTTAPTLPATTLAGGCYSSMFINCSSLTTAPELPATTLTSECYFHMFASCTSLTTAPELPATTLTTKCYSGMFNNCSSLTTAPELPASTLAEECYMGMFGSCTSLTTAPELPATTLAEYCYASMFTDCRSLTTAPELPATTLANSCYSGMFSDCSFTTAPELPATTLAEMCYDTMFIRCTSLTNAPELPATELAMMCYNMMFSECSNLQSVITYGIEWDIMNSTSWLQDAGTNVTNPTIYCPANSTLKNFTNDNSGIPTGWVQVDIE